jgi:hypothetical protein
MLLSMLILEWSSNDLNPQILARCPWVLAHLTFGLMLYEVAGIEVKSVQGFWLQGMRVTQMSEGSQKCQEKVWDQGLGHPAPMRRVVLDHLLEKEGELLLTKSTSD